MVVHPTLALVVDNAPHRIKAGSGPDVVSPLNFKTLIREYRRYHAQYKLSAVVTEATVQS